MDKKVCLSLKELYNNGIKELHYGGIIFHTTEGNQDYFDLRRKGTVDIVACDGEEFELEIKTSGHVILRHIMTNNTVWLSIEEYNIGVFFVGNDVSSINGYRHSEKPKWCNSKNMPSIEHIRVNE